jgi:hypothetical protein
MSVQFVIIGNPENRRIGFFQQALHHLKLLPASVISYLDAIAHPELISQFNSPETIIRFESPEKNFAVEKAIIAVGASVKEEGNYQKISVAELTQLEFEKGRILYPRQWYLGWKSLLQTWESFLGCAVMNHPQEIALMYDKPATHHLLQTHQVPVAKSLGIIHSYEHLREVMKLQKTPRIFVKLATGSAASGIVAYYANPHREVAITTVERVRENGTSRFYNSRKIRQYYHQEEIADIINFLCHEGVQVEQWLPKAKLDHSNFDLRVVVIDGKAQHLVVRLSQSPMTNLHLKNQRGDPEMFFKQVGIKNWHTMQQTCEQVAALFPQSLSAGIDLLVDPDFCRHSILEVNAFGDLLPGITWQGMDTYTSEVKAVLQSFVQSEENDG